MLFRSAKKDLEEKISAFGRKSNNRFELAIAFLKDANQAEKYAQQENPERIREYLQKIGSNFRIAERTLLFPLKNAFQIAEKYHAEAQRAEATSYDFTKSENWRRGWDSNPRGPYGPTAFRERRFRPTQPPLRVKGGSPPLFLSIFSLTRRRLAQEKNCIKTTTTIANNHQKINYLTIISRCVTIYLNKL